MMEEIMNGQMIEFAGNGQTFEGYLSPASRPSPGVIVIQEWWGLVDHIKDICDRFAAAGFTAFAPDFYHGQKTTSPDEAGKLFMALNIVEAEKILRGATDRLLTDASCSSNNAGIIGFCMGGQLALFGAAANPDKISACADFYGIHPNVHPAIEKLKAPILGIFGKRDKSVGPDKVNQLSEKLSAAGKKHDFHIYPESNHAFFNNSGPNYNPTDAADAWTRVLDFFRAFVA